jgi:putative tricarboxylic transport membrane protein
MIPPRPLFAKLVSAAIAVAALVFIYGSLKMPMGTILTPAAGLVPLLLGCGTLALAIVTILGKEPAAAEDASGLEDEGGDQANEGRKAPRPLLIMIVLGLIIFAFERAGFIVSLMGGSFLLLRFVEKKPFVLSFIISLVLSGGLYLLFTKLLYVSLPGGWLEF